MKRGFFDAMDRLGIEVLSVFGMPPLAFVELAADLGCRHISLGLEPMPENPHGYPRWSLRDDPALRRALVAALEDRRISIALGEGYVFRPGPHTTLRCAAEGRDDSLCDGGEMRADGAGSGELPLAEILSSLPRDVVVSLEVPMLAKASAGIGPRERLLPCVDAARRLLAQLA